MKSIDERLDLALDQALEMTFPASDPIALSPAANFRRSPASIISKAFRKDEEMDALNISALARHLFETQGASAIAEAAQKAAHFERAGDGEQAKMWQRVESVLREMRGPRQG